MTTTLAALRRHPQPTPAKFLAAQAGCWLQYYDDTPAKDPAKALSAPTFDLLAARRKQVQRCAVTFSLQPFGKARVQRELLCMRSLGVDIDLIPPNERGKLSREEIDRHKEEYLVRRLLSLHLEPHWLTETAHGFHAIFRIQPQRTQVGIEDAVALNRRLVAILQGDENAVLLTQVLRVPGTLQFKDPAHPFLCRLLIDNAAAVAPYSLNAVRGVLDTWEVFHGTKDTTAKPARTDAGEAQPTSRWREGLGGVPEGQRNATATSVIGSILSRLPEELWETAGWGGLKEWNGRNRAALPERELRSVFDSISRREREQRKGGQSWVSREMPVPLLVKVDVRIRTAQHDAGESNGTDSIVPTTTPPPAPC